MTIQTPQNPFAFDQPQPETPTQTQPQTPEMELPMPPQPPMPIPPVTQAMPQAPLTPQAQSTPQPVAYQPPPVAASSNGVALTAMILGIVGAVVGFWAVVPITGYLSAAFGFPLALAAVICGHIGRSRSKRVGGVGRIQALVGFILGYVSIAVMVIASAAWTLFLFVGAV